GFRQHQSQPYTVNGRHSRTRPDKFAHGTGTIRRPEPGSIVARHGVQPRGEAQREAVRSASGVVTDPGVDHLAEAVYILGCGTQRRANVLPVAGDFRPLARRGGCGACQFALLTKLIVVRAREYV